MRFTIITFVALASVAIAITPNNAGAKNVGTGNGSQFITGGCVANADCASACCANASGVGVCSAEAAQFQNGKKGCGFVDPNKAATIAAAKAQVQKQGFKRVVRQELVDEEVFDEEEFDEEEFDEEDEEEDEEEESEVLSGQFV